MSEQPVDMILPILREIRAKQDGLSQQQDGLGKQVAALAQGQVSVRAELKELRGDVRGMRDALHEVAIAIDGHSVRLDRIEQHLGLTDPQH